MNVGCLKVLNLVEPHTIKVNYEYTINEVSILNLKELTELALFIPNFLTPSEWKFKLSWENGDIVLPGGTIVRPSLEVIDAIKSRIQTEGYVMFDVTKQYTLQFIESIGCLTDRAFYSCIKNDVICYHVETQVAYEQVLLIEETTLSPYEVKWVPLTKENATNKKQLELLQSFCSSCFGFSESTKVRHHWHGALKLELDPVCDQCWIEAAKYL